MNITPINCFQEGIQFATTGKIWKIITDSSMPVIIVQTRDGDAYQTAFTAINIQSQTTLWQDFTLEESWWVGMSLLSQGILLLHTYPDTQKPQPQGLIALEIASREVLWQTEELHFYEVIDNQIVVTSSTTSSNSYLTIDIKTGNVLERFQELPTGLTRKNENKSMIFPFHYQDEMAYFQTVAVFLKKKFNLQIVQAVDYLEYDNFIIISYFYDNAGDLMNNLLVLDQNGQVLFHQNIEKQLTGIGLDTFFVFKNELFFVKHKTLLQSLKL
ncbi:MAG TPA: hypothetical protein DCS93_38875 [Microscillaceae bacterium]|nr:hypothetical protein [Microscillaceae bacterium]